MYDIPIQNDTSAWEKMKLAWIKQGFIQGPNESDQDFQTRAQRCIYHKEVQADEYLYGWIPVRYTNKGLSFLEAGATFTTEIDGVQIPIIHLRTSFKHAEKWLIYTKEEVLQHELVHARRICFHESKYEEMLAYFASPSKFRKLLGPLLRKPNELYVFLFPFFFSLALPSAYSALFAMLVPLFFVIRLQLTRRCFNRALQKIGGDIELLYSLSDAQIDKLK